MEECIRRKLVEVIQYATLAPSPRNSQPWKFSITEGSIRIHPDFSRQLPVSDPQHRELYMSLGCAMENLAIALDYQGYGPKVTPSASFSTSESSEEYLEATFQGGHKGKNATLFEAISKRKSNLGRYEDRAIPKEDLAEIKSIPLEAGVSMCWLEDKLSIHPIADLILKADQLQLSNQNFRDELLTWLRFSSIDMRMKGDGLPARQIWNHSWPKWLGAFFTRHSNLAKKMSVRDREMLKSLSGIMVFSTETDSKEDWVKAGRSFERFALRACSLGIQYDPINQPIEIPEIREQLQKLLGLRERVPQLLVRVGYAQPMPQLQRRAIEDMLVETIDTLFAR